MSVTALLDLRASEPDGGGRTGGMCTDVEVIPIRVGDEVATAVIGERPWAPPARAWPTLIRTMYFEEVTPTVEDLSSIVYAPRDGRQERTSQRPPAIGRAGAKPLSVRTPASGSNVRSPPRRCMARSSPS